MECICLEQESEIISTSCGVSDQSGDVDELQSVMINWFMTCFITVQVWENSLHTNSQAIRQLLSSMKVRKRLSASDYDLPNILVNESQLNAADCIQFISPNCMQFIQFDTDKQKNHGNVKVPVCFISYPWAMSQWSRASILYFQLLAWVLKR